MAGKDNPMTFWIKNHRGEYVNIDDPNLKWEKPAPRYIDPMECPHCRDDTQVNRRFTESGMAVCDNCKSAFEPGLVGQWIIDPPKI